MKLRYFGSLIYDALVVFSLCFLFTALCLLINNNLAIPSNTRWYQSALLLVLITYYVFSIKYSGQTIGMRAWRLKLIATKEAVTFRLALRRLLLSMAILILKPFFFTKTEKFLARWTAIRLIKLSAT